MFVAFCAGWAFGAGVMWLHFYLSGLIRTREEWEAARKQDPLS